MKKIIAMSLSFCCTAALYAVDWSQIGSSYTVAAGETVTVTDADIESVNALTMLTVNGTCEFATSTPPTMPLEGNGVCRKTSAGDWTMSTEWKGWKGSWIFEAGTIDGTVPSAFGYTDSSNDDDSAVYIRDGATLRLSTAHTSGYFFLYKWFHIAGSGKNGQGAILVDMSDAKDGYIGRIALDADALIGIPDGKSVNFQNGEIRLNGKALTFTGGQYAYFSTNEKFIGPGTVVMDEGMNFDFINSSAGFAQSEPRIRLVAKGGNTVRLMHKSKTCCPWPQQYADIDVSGTFTLIHSHNSVTHTQIGRPEALNLVWNGDVSLASETDKLLVSCDQTAKHCMVTIKGNISGSGSVQAFRDANDGYARIAFDGTNTFSGTMSANLANGGAVVLCSSNSIPDYASFTAAGGRVTLGLGDGADWCTDSIARFITSANLGSGATVALSAVGALDGTSALNIGFLDDLPASETPTVAADGGRIELSGPSDGRYHHFAAIDGELVFTGSEPIYVGESFAHSGLNGQSAGTLVFDGAKNVHLGSDAEEQYSRILLPGLPSFIIGKNMPADAIGRMTVRDSKIVEDRLQENPNESAKYGIFVGTTYDKKGYPGILTVEDGAEISGKVFLASSSSNTVGVLVQSGGIVKNAGHNEDKWSYLTAQNGYACQELALGTYALMGRSECAVVEGSEYVLRQSGGTFIITNHLVDTGWAPGLRSGNGRSDFHIGGGEFLSYGTITFCTESGLGSATLTLDGEGTSFRSNSGVLYGAVGKPGRFTVNLNGGVMDVGSLGPTAGTLCAGSINAAGGEFICAGAPKFDRITVFGGGFTFADKTANQRTFFTMPIESPTGNGVKSVPLPDELSADTTLLGPPLVEISESGEGGIGAGASAIALYDRRTGRVSGVKVTSPGRDYTKAVATFHYAGRTWTSECVLAENVPGGGFTKKGPGQVFLSATNTYAGATIVKEGGLSASCDWAFPSNTVLRLDGGNIGLGAYRCEFAAIGGTGGNLGVDGKRDFTIASLVPGTTSSVAFNGCGLKVAGESRFDVSRLLSGETTEYAASVVFAPGATVAFDNAELLEGEAAEAASPITVVKVSEGYAISGVPAWVEAAKYGSWRFRVTTRSVKLIKRRGMRITVR